MHRIAVIEDDPTTSAQLAGWVRAARPELVVDQHFDRDSAEVTCWAWAWSSPCSCSSIPSENGSTRRTDGHVGGFGFIWWQGCWDRC